VQPSGQRQHLQPSQQKCPQLPAEPRVLLRLLCICLLSPATAAVTSSC
jgi:hypothetical protein